MVRVIVWSPCLIYWRNRLFYCMTFELYRREVADLNLVFEWTPSQNVGGAHLGAFINQTRCQFGPLAWLVEAPKWAPSFGLIWVSIWVPGFSIRALYFWSVSSTFYCSKRCVVRGGLVVRFGHIVHDGHAVHCDRCVDSQIGDAHTKMNHNLMSLLEF